MGKFYKIIISFIAVTILIMSMEINSYAAAFNAPYLPYIPPADVQILGLINNMYGLTAISEANETTKLEAYWNMYRAIMGSAFDTFKVQMQEVLNGAKTSRKIIISPTLNQTINAALKNALQNNIPVGTATPAAVNPAQWVERLAEHGITMTLQQAQDLQNRIGNRYTGASNTPYTLGVFVGKDGQYNNNIIQFMPYYVGIEPYFQDNSNHTIKSFLYGNGQIVSPFYKYYINLDTLVVGNFFRDLSGGNDFFVYNNIAFTMGAQQHTTSVSAMSQTASSSITAQSQIPLTAETEIVNGEVDSTESVVVNLSNVIPYPAIDPQQIADVLRDLGVVPVSESSDVSETVSQLREEAAAEYGDVGDYSLDLTNLFPFCIPFDIGYAISIFAADPQAPSFDWVFPVGYEDGELVYQTFNVNLSAFDSVALVLRKGLDILLIIGLGMITRDKFLRG